MKNIKKAQWRIVFFLIHVLYYMLLAEEKCHPGLKAYTRFILNTLHSYVWKFWLSKFKSLLIFQDNELLDLEEEYEDLLIKYETQVGTFHCSLPLPQNDEFFVT